jgi:RNA polymerase sigma-70 factor (ECF subfamily)
MEDPAPTISMEKLVAHREWVRRVARALVRDESLADDLEQEVWLEALQRPPRSGRSFGGWLAAAMRHNLMDRRRSDDRRRIREEMVARPEAERPASDLVAEAEVLKSVVAAVLAIEEPARGTLLLRYFEDLSPREISVRQGIPVETVRTRIKRALEQLRGSLGGDGGREGLMLAIAPLLANRWSGIGAGTAGGVAMGTAVKVGLALAVAALAVGGVAILQWPRSRPVAQIPQPPRAVTTPVRRSPDPSPDTTSRPEPAAAPLPPPIPKAVEKDVPAGPAIEERLDSPVEKLSYEGVALASILMELARTLDLEPEYESEALKRYCAAHPVYVSFHGTKLRQVLTGLLGTAGSPEEGKVMSWEVRGKSLLVLLRDPTPPKESTPEGEARKQEVLGILTLNRMKSHTTTFSFDGSQSLEEAFAYLSAQQTLNIVVDGRAMERCRTVKVKLSLKDAPINEALDELLRLDPNMTWEVKGNLVIVRNR